MMFQKKQKVTQYLGNSFKDFNEDYDNLTKNLGSKFSHLRSGGSSSNLNSIHQKDQSKQIGSTWDSKHLDTFVSKSPWATQTQYQTSDANSNGNQKQLSSSVANGSRPNTKKSNSNRPTLNAGVRESFFFSTVSRFTDDENFKMIDYPDRYSDKNFLVSDRKDYDPKYFQANFSVIRHQDKDSMRLSMCNHKSPLMTPAQKLDQLVEIKHEQKEFQEWKKQYGSMNKRHRVHKGMYPSGILQVDNPCNAESQLYLEESKKQIEKQMRTQKFKQVHSQRLALLERSNPQIEFMNTYSRKNLKSEEGRNPLNNASTRFQSQYDIYNPTEKLAESKIVPFSNSNRERISVEWSCKRPVTTNIDCQGKDTNDRLFGAEAKNFSLVRAKYLREQDTKQRNYNVISFADNKVEFKQDQGIQQGLANSIIV